MTLNKLINFKTLAGKLSSSDSIKARIASGGIWMGAGNMFEQFIRLARNMILTRILAPEAFGLMAIVLSVNAAFESFTQIGIKEAIIQSPNGKERTYLNGAWWVAFGRAAALYVIVYISAPWVADFYKNPELVPLMRVAFLALLLNGIVSSEAYVALKSMKFRRWVVSFCGGGAVGVLTTILLAFYLRNVWALVIGFCVESFARCILSFVVFPFCPRFDFDKAHLKALLKYAKGMFGLPILTFIFMKSDIFVIGKVCTMEDLGLYSMASVMAWVPFNFLTMVMSQVLMPAFSEKQDDKEWINRSILKFTSLIVFLGFPLLFLIAFYGRDLLNLVYGEPYGVISIPFTIIFSLALMRTCSIPIATVFFASGRPELHRLFVGVRAIIIVILIYPAVKMFGLAGAASAGLISMLVGYFFQVKRIKSITEFNLGHYCNIFLKGLCISSFVIIICTISKNLYSSGPILNMLPGLAGCLVAYFFAAKLFFQPNNV